MAFWSKKKAQPAAVCCYGKLTATGDFIRHNNAGAECAAFDHWLSQSINLARESMGESFATHFEPALGVFIYRGEEGDGEPERGLLGVWAASGDSAGRKYPMMVATSYDYEQMLAAGAGLPIAAWPFIQSAYALVANGRKMAVAEFVAKVAALEPVSLDAPEAACAGYRSWLQQTTLRALWLATFGTVDNRFAVLQSIHASVEIFSGQQRPQTSLALRFPIYQADTYAAAVWLDITQRVSQLKRTVFNAFWTPHHDLMVHVGAPHHATFRELISWGGDADHVTDLLRTAAVADARERLPSNLQRAFDEPDQPLAAVLEAIG